MVRIELTKREEDHLRWLLFKGTEITNSDSKYDSFCDIVEKLNGHVKQSTYYSTEEVRERERKLIEPIKYYISVLDEVSPNWRKQPDHVGAKFLEAEKFLNDQNHERKTKI